jgi:alpha-tubulin suppressor-like RCC1 family protein
VGNNTNQSTPQQAKSGSGLTPIVGAKDVQSCYMADESTFNWYNTYILKTDGTVLGCGNGANYLRGDGQNSTSPTYFTDVRTSATAKLQNIVKIFCKGYSIRLALDSSGNLWSWGDNSWGYMGDGTAEGASVQWAKIIATGVEDVNLSATSARIGKVFIKIGGKWYSSGYNSDYALLIGWRDGTVVSVRKEMALPYGKEVKQWVSVGSYAGGAIGSTMFQTTDGDIYVGGYLDYILGNGKEYLAAPTKVYWNIN